MLLLTMNQILWPSQLDPAGPPSQTVIAFATNLSLEHAILRLKEHEDAYIERYEQNIRHDLQAVAHIEDTSHEALALVEVRMIEHLAITPEAF